MVKFAGAANDSGCKVLYRLEFLYILLLMYSLYKNFNLKLKARMNRGLSHPASLLFNKT